jgi:D-sedoheptulose 7-phosphate isomerase
MATEFVSRLTKDFERQGLPALALTTDTSFLTAFTNDCGFDCVFERQVQTFGKPGDALIGISTSGNSANVLKAMEAARDIGMKTIGLVGLGGRMYELADIIVSVPSQSTQHIQECHLAIEHVLCDLVERILFGKVESAGSSLLRDQPLTQAANMYSTMIPQRSARVKVAVGVIVQNNSGKILLERRLDNGWWGLPGGGIESGESVEHTATREVFEETGLHVRLKGLVGVYSFPEDGRIVTYPDNGDVVQLVDIVVHAEIVGGQLKTGLESYDVGFFDTDSLPKTIVPPALKPLADFISALSNVIR